MHESDYDGDGMNFGLVATTTNMSKDSAEDREAEKKYRDLMAGNDSVRTRNQKTPEVVVVDGDSGEEAAPIDINVDLISDGDGESTASPDKSPPKKFIAKKDDESKESGMLTMKMMQAPVDDESAVDEDKKAGNEEESKGQGQNFVVDDKHRSTAIEIFESYFAKAYARKN